MKSFEEIRNILLGFVPTHSNLELVSLSEQRLTRSTSRILVTMKRKENFEKLVQRLDTIGMHDNESGSEARTNIDHLNQFRDKYFSTKKL